ncbi:MAG: (2Fe-2S) ferredoxin domain-containing protein [Spirochaetales bacterium]|jgi:NADP-reducing hydrogenase subunit HndB|nr:(2Fe-2S) ferredoxin domain-containing protein [Spirochaetales bacterium]
MKLKPEDLEKISDRMKASTTLRDGAGKARITVHMGTCGIASGARDIMKAFMKQIEEKDIPDVIFTTSGCAGLCSHEPMATIEIRDEAPVKYVNLNEEKVQKIFQDHVIGGKVVQDYALGKGHERIG